MTFSEIVKEVAEHYASDPSRASVTVSFLADGTYYASIVRYTKRLGEGKEVVTRLRDTTLEAAIAGVYENWKLTLTQG